MVRCRFGNLYTGVSTDVARRFQEHQAGAARSARNLRGKGPLHLVFSAAAGDRSTAARLEARLKKLSKQQKEALVCGELRLEDVRAGAICTGADPA
ncbi:MAG: GIY-YIG nuclease family protein [Pseudomonadales bacterium]|nr:GIY-YIG nuclease family protein [Pseudomonadales bacterium]